MVNVVAIPMNEQSYSKQQPCHIPLRYMCLVKTKCQHIIYFGHFRLQWSSAPVSQEFQPKTRSFETTTDMAVKMKRQF